MGAAAEKLRMSEADYLDWESRAKEKHEYVAGEIFAMAGASERHNRIAGNVFFHLRQATRGHSCRAFMADMKLRIADHRSYYYPDVMLVCDDSDNHPIYKTAPCFIAEVLSPSTEAYDRGDKFAAYRRFTGLKTVLFLSQDRPHVECFTRGEDGRWILSEASGDTASLALPAFGFELALADLYRDLPDATPDPAATAN